MFKPFADYRLIERPVLILEKTAILALYGYRRYHEKIKHLATKCWPGASFAKFTLYVNSDGGDEENRTLYPLKYHFKILNLRFINTSISKKF